MNLLHEKRGQRIVSLAAAVGMALGLWIGANTARGAGPPEASEAMVLVAVNEGFVLAGVQTNDAAVSLSRTGSEFWLRVQTGHKAPWPGITLCAPDGHWNLAPYHAVRIPVRNSGTNRVAVFCRVDNPGADGTKNCLTGQVSLEPGLTGALEVELKRTSEQQLGGKLFGMRGYPVVWGGPGTINPSNVTQLVVFVNKPGEPHAFDLGTVRAVGSYVAPTAFISDADPFLPFIDTFGQYRHKDWPGKTHSVDELRTTRKQPRWPHTPDRRTGTSSAAGLADRNWKPRASSTQQSTKTAGGWWTPKAACSGLTVSTVFACSTPPRSTSGKAGSKISPAKARTWPAT